MTSVAKISREPLVAKIVGLAIEIPGQHAAMLRTTGGGDKVVEFVALQQACGEVVVGRRVLGPEALLTLLLLGIAVVILGM